VFEMALDRGSLLGVQLVGDIGEQELGAALVAQG
jgi:hypothetical protein